MARGHKVPDIPKNFGCKNTGSEKGQNQLEVGGEERHMKSRWERYTNNAAGIPG